MFYRPLTLSRHSGNAIPAKLAVLMRNQSISVALQPLSEGKEARFPMLLCVPVILAISGGCYWLIIESVRLLISVLR